jgi:lipoprotein-anchoring transpeptidase ErfK/SrfK
MPKGVTGQGIFMRLLSGWRPAIAAAFVLSVLSTAPALADVVVHIDKSAQRMSVSVNGQPRYTWPVSTGRSGYGTPSGVFAPQVMARSWFSKKYYNSPMPHSIFFYHGFAIHGTTDIRRLGGPASHGCVRLHPSNAAALYALVERNGRGSTRIEIY